MNAIGDWAGPTLPRGRSDVVALGHLPPMVRAKDRA